MKKTQQFLLKLLNSDSFLQKTAEDLGAFIYFSVFHLSVNG